MNDNFQKRFKRRTAEQCSLRKGKVGASINDCFRPSAEASKADLVEYHKEEMGIRKAKRRQPQQTYATLHLAGSDLRNYSITPKGKKRTRKPEYV